MNEAIPVPTKFAHLVLKTSRFREQQKFYQELLGARIVHEAPGMIFLSYDDEHHRLAIMERPGLLPKLKNMVGIDHHAYTYDTLEDLLVTWRRMKSNGHDAVWCTHHGGTISIYYQDRDNNVVETQVDVFNCIDEVNTFLLSDDFQSNPIGVDFDPEDLWQPLQAGEAWETLKLRKPSGPRDPATIPRAYLGGFAWTMLQLMSRFRGENKKTEQQKPNH